MKLSCLKLILLLGLTSWPGFTCGSEEAYRLLDQLDKRYNHLNSLVADFTQTFESQALGRGIVEQGTLAIKIPGKMRWDYLSPEKKLAVCNGSDTWLYLEEDNTVIKGSLDASRGNIAILSLLSGQADLNEIFRGEILSKHKEETKIKIWLKQSCDDFDHLIVTVESKNGLITRIEAIDPIGNKMIYSFQNIKENMPVDPQIFYFSIPPHARIKFETGSLE